MTHSPEHLEAIARAIGRQIPLMSEFEDAVPTDLCAQAALTTAIGLGYRFVTEADQRPLTDKEIDHLAAELRPARSEIERLRGDLETAKEALRHMLFDGALSPDHMTACERTMGATHPCTCGADEARAFLEAQS